MKLFRHGTIGREKPGLIDGTGKMRDLSKVLDDITPATLSPQGLDQLRAVDAGSLPLIEGKPRLGCPVAGIRNFIAIGLNYTDHAAESGLPVPEEPIIFSKHLSSISGPDDDIVLPPKSRKGDWEVELGVFIGRPAKAVSEADALSHVAGYAIVNDVSEREFQIERKGQWVKGKSLDTFGPIGPWLVTRDEVADPQALSHVAGAQWRARAGRDDGQDDLRRSGPGVLSVAVHDADARRYPHHRHAGRGRHGHEAAALPHRR